MTSENRSRREFLTASGAVLSTSWLALNIPLLVAAGETAQSNIEGKTAYQNITRYQSIEISALVDQIVPADETPGATDMGVVYFIDAAFGGFMAAAMPMLNAGLENLQKKAIESDPGVERFSELSLAKQTELLKAEENTAFFGTIHFLTLCGMFCLPKYGGNRDQAGWELLGFDHRHVWQPPFGYYDKAVHTGEAHDKA